MLTLQVKLDHKGYPIYIGENIYHRTDLILPFLSQKKVAIVTNTTIAPLYLEALTQSLNQVGITVIPIILPDGEQYKTWETLNLIFHTLLTHHCERNTTLIALGGGVVGDMTGFAAATFLRGVPFIQIPTTLLAQVDSSVGGKTGINHPLGKNMIGAFYQPLAVIADTKTLDTLPERELAAGLAEVIKYGLIADADFFEWLEQNITVLLKREPAALAYAIQRSCEHKAQIVAADEKEQGIRALLNLGHTFGHAIEAGTGFSDWLHGEAVAAGIMLAAETSRQLGLLHSEDVQRIERLLQKAKLPTTAPAFSVDRYLTLMAHDKKVKEGKIHFILLKRIGEAIVVNDVPTATLIDVLSSAFIDG